MFDYTIFLLNPFISFFLALSFIWLNCLVFICLLSINCLTFLLSYILLCSVLYFSAVYWFAVQLCLAWFVYISIFNLIVLNALI